MAVVGNNYEMRWIPGDIRLLRYLHDHVAGHVFRYSALMYAFECCSCEALWMPDISREVTEACDWLRWPTKRDKFLPYVG